MTTKRIFSTRTVILLIILCCLVVFACMNPQHQTETTSKNGITYSVDTVKVNNHEIVVLSRGVGADWGVMGCFESSTCPICHKDSAENFN